MAPHNLASSIRALSFTAQKLRFTFSAASHVFFRVFCKFVCAAHRPFAAICFRLQRHGFTLGVADILVSRKADRERAKAIRELRSMGPDIARRAFGLEEDAKTLAIRRRTAAAYNNPQRDPTDVKTLDTTMKQTVAKYTERINNACVPNGLIRTFPDNALQTMIQSGAKGSMASGFESLIERSVAAMKSVCSLADENTFLL